MIRAFVAYVCTASGMRCVSVGFGHETGLGAVGWAKDYSRAPALEVDARARGGKTRTLD